MAVPATTAVLAIPRIRPGIGFPSGSGRRHLGGVKGVERLDYLGCGDALERKRYATIAPYRGDKRGSPAVLVHDHDGGATGLENLGCLGSLFLDKQTGGRARSDEIGSRR